jgi:hypothetical protein
VLLFYIDEYGDTELTRQRANSSLPWALKPGSSEWFVLSAVGIPETSRLDFARRIQEVKATHFPKDFPSGPWKNTEIKGRFLRMAGDRLQRGKYPLNPLGYRALSSTDKLERLCADLARLWPRFRPLVYVVAIDKKKLIQRTRNRRLHPLGIAYTYLQQRLSLLVAQVYGQTEGVLMIADEQSAHESFFRQGQVHKVRTHLTDRGRMTRPPDFNLILDKPIWINPDLNVMDREIIQLADITAYSAARLIQSNAVPAEPWFFWQQIAACLSVHWTSGCIEGGGLTIYPKPNPYPPGLA